jgi:nicotinamidase-related amidase
MSDLELHASTTAIMLIDLQHGIMAYPTAPYATATITQRAAELAARFREKGSLVIYVCIDLAKMLDLPVDQSHRDPSAPPPPPIASEIVPEAGRRSGDLRITKRHWDAFAVPELERTLRASDIGTVVLCGVATHIGVESTARSAASRGFAVVLAEDATTSTSADAHQYAITNIFPQLGRVRSTAQLHPR